MNIVEAYSKKLAISEKVYEKEHGGRALPNTKKIAIARVLANTSEFLNEAFANTTGTQLGNMSTYKKFCLDLTTVALPNLIANELVLVYPMKSRTGYVQYMEFIAGSNKGGVKQNDVFNNPFKLGDMTEERVQYTSSAVVEPIAADATTFKAAWTPNGNVRLIKADGTEDVIDAEDAKEGVEITAGDYVKAAYVYDNVVIPQHDLPTLNVRMTGIPLEAKARRIAIYYSQMAAFQAKTEMGIDLGEVLATQACAELSYEIDTEVVTLLYKNARKADELTFNKALPAGVSKRDHYAGFAEVIELASQIIYDRTKKHAANYMVVSSSVKPILAMMEGWKAANQTKINGPYFAGSLNGIKVFVSPALAAGDYFLGYNGDDMITSAAVYAPYMAIVPTQALGFADGANSQGFATMYDLKLLNDALLVGGKVVNEERVIKMTTGE